MPLISRRRWWRPVPRFDSEGGVLAAISSSVWGGGITPTSEYLAAHPSNFLIARCVTCCHYWLSALGGPFGSGAFRRRHGLNNLLSTVGASCAGHRSKRRVRRGDRAGLCVAHGLRHDE